MNKTSIPYVDYSFNLVTGCYHDCPYCYARKIANRFKPKYKRSNTRIILSKRLCYEQLGGPKESFPHGFIPTFYRGRADEPAKLKKPSRIFHCDMGDLFGDWVPEEWIKADVDAAIASPWHTHLYLTKNPRRMVETFVAHNFWICADLDKHLWLGTTVTSQGDMERVRDLVKIKDFMPDVIIWVSVEPMAGPVTFQEYYREEGQGTYSLLIDYLDWIVAGPLTGKKSLFEPQWLCDLAQECKAFEVPFYDKRDVIGIGLREFPK